MTLIFEQDSIMPPTVLAAVYFVVMVIGIRKLYLLQRVSQGMNTRKLFVMNCLLSSILRFLSFASMTIFVWCEFHVDLDSSGTTTEGDDDQYNPDKIDFFEKASLVLFDLPDFCFISAYVLLLVVWAEAILQSRRHWWSSTNFRKTWMMGYVVFNSLLYIIQVALYSLLFVPTVDQGILTDLIYLTLTGINLLLPIIWLCVYLYLVIMVRTHPMHPTYIHPQHPFLTLTSHGPFPLSGNQFSILECFRTVDVRVPLHLIRRKGPACRPWLPWHILDLHADRLGRCRAHQRGEGLDHLNCYLVCDLLHLPGRFQEDVWA
jgi:hypothetical protein